MKVELKHQNGFHSVISNDRGHHISIDTMSSDDPQGPSPMELLLMGVAGLKSPNLHGSDICVVRSFGTRSSIMDI